MSGSFDPSAAIQAAIAGKPLPIPVAAPSPGQPSPSVDLPTWAGGAPPAAAPAPVPDADAAETSQAAPMNVRSALAAGIAGKPIPVPTTSDKGTTLARIGLGAIPAGLYSGVASIADVPTAAVNLGADAINYLTGAHLGHLAAPVNPNPTGFEPQGGLEKSVYSGAQAVGSLPALAVGGEAAEPLLTGTPQAVAKEIGNISLARGALPAAVSGAAGEAAGEAAPDNLKGVAKTAGSLVAGSPVALAEEAVLPNAARLVSPETAALAKTARDTYGIPVTGGQISESPFIRHLNSVLQRLPFTGYTAQNEAQRTAFNRAVSNNLLGTDAPKITDTVMAETADRLSSAYNDFANRFTASVDEPLIDSLGGIEHNASLVIPEGSMAPIRRQISNILDLAQKNDGTIPGRAFKSLTSRGSPLDLLTRAGDPSLRYYGIQIRNALNDLLERQAPPELRQSLAQTNFQWKNMKMLEDLVEKSPTGDISPQGLLQQVRKAYPKMAYGGAGAAGDLARIGQRFITEPPSSLTAERGTILHLLKEGGGAAAGALLGAGGSEVTGDPLTTLGTLASTAMLARATGAALRSKWYTNRLIKSGLTGKIGPQSGPVGSAVRTLGGVQATEALPQPGGNQTSTNPETGLPEYSLRANQQKNVADQGALAAMADEARGNPRARNALRARIADFAATRLLSPSGDGPQLHERDGMKNWLAENKQAIRSVMGGQGIQNLNRVAAALRRPSVLSELIANWANYAKNSNSPLGRTAFAMQPESIVSAAMQAPELASVLSGAVPAGGKLSNPLQSAIARRLTAAT